MLFLIPAAFLLLGVVAIGAGVRRVIAGRRFRRRAQRAHGVVTEIRLERSRSLDDPGEPPLRRAVVRFTTNAGAEIVTPVQIASSLEALRAGDLVLVLYDPDDPTQAQLERNRGTEVVLAALLIVLGFMLAAGGVLGLAVAAVATDVVKSFELAPSTTAVPLGGAALSR
jgi:hypothetical protein